jgi:hypothetical protein
VTRRLQWIDQAPSEPAGAAGDQYVHAAESGERQERTASAPAFG